MLKKLPKAIPQDESNTDKVILDEFYFRWLKNSIIEIGEAE